MMKKNQQKKSEQLLILECKTVLTLNSHHQLNIQNKRKQRYSEFCTTISL